MSLSAVVSLLLAQVINIGILLAANVSASSKPVHLIRIGTQILAHVSALKVLIAKDCRFGTAISALVDVLIYKTVIYLKFGIRLAANANVLRH